MKPQHGDDGISYYQFESIDPQRVHHGVFTRHGGVSSKPFHSLNLSASVPDSIEAVEENRRRFYGAMRFERERAVRTIQVHGSYAKPVSSMHLDTVVQGTDGLVTNEADLALVMAFADCVPILLYAESANVLGIAHAGWRGAAAGIAQNTVSTMVSEYGCSPAEIQAAIGPSIGPCCYEVGENVLEAFSVPGRDLDGYFEQVGKNRYRLNLWLAIEQALNEVGVTKVEQSEMCTSCRVDEFYSHRAEKGKTGRFGMLAALTTT